jgi:tetratricopeptide (TPR) repeat protein
MTLRAIIFGIFGLVLALSNASSAGLPDACRNAKDKADAQTVLDGCEESTDPSASAEDRARRLYFRAYAYVELGKLDEAADALKKAIALAPGMAALHHELAYIQVEIGEFDAAEASASEAMRLAPNDPEHPQERGFARLSKGDYAGAADDFGTSLRLGGTPGMRSMRAYASALAGEIDAARTDLATLDNTKAVAENEFYRKLATTLVDSIKTADDTAAARQKCADAFEAMTIEKQFASICTWAMRVAATPADRANALRFRSFVWQYAVKLDEPAKSDIEAAVRLNPNDHGTLGQRCTTLRDTAERRRQVVRAIADCTRAIELCDKPDCKLAMQYNRGWCYYTIREYDSALADAEAYIAAKPDRADGYHLRGAIKLRKGDRDGAKADLLKAKELGGKSDDLKALLKEVGVEL